MDPSGTSIRATWRRGAEGALVGRWARGAGCARGAGGTRGYNIKIHFKVKILNKYTIKIHFKVYVVSTIKPIFNYRQNRFGSFSYTVLAYM